MELFSNSWVIGIGGGILSGLLVTLITRHLFSRRDNREYTQKVVTANQEILYAVRPGISEGVIPTQDVLDSLISATALKYNVDARDLHNATAFADVLVKEVMDSSFLAASAKADFCQKLAQLRPTQEPAQVPDELAIEPTRNSTRLSDYRRRMITMMSMMMGVLAALMTVVFAFRGFFDNQKVEVPSSKELMILVPTVITILVAFTATYSMWMFRFLERKRKERHPSSSDLPKEDSKEDQMQNN